jgi:hypothetical protein
MMKRSAILIGAAARCYSPRPLINTFEARSSRSHRQVVEKFHWLSEACADEQLRGRLIDAVDRLDTQPVPHLMGLLARVRPTPAYARTHRGIQ